MFSIAGLITGAMSGASLIALFTLWRAEHRIGLRGSPAQVSYAFNSLLVMAFVFGVLFVLLTWVVPHID